MGTVTMARGRPPEMGVDGTGAAETKVEASGPGATAEVPGIGAEAAVRLWQEHLVLDLDAFKWHINHTLLSENYRFQNYYGLQKGKIDWGIAAKDRAEVEKRYVR